MVPVDQAWVDDYETAERQPLALRLVHEAEWKPIKPPAESMAPNSMRWKGQDPLHIATYTDYEDGAPIGYVCRYLDPDKPGAKQVRAWTYGRMTDAPHDEWACRQFTKPKPIYRLWEALQEDSKQLVIVAGEKKTDELQQVLPGQVVISWAGGDKQARNVDWEPLSFRKKKYVFLWPDCDDSCREAMAHVGGELFRMGYAVKVIQVGGKEPGWDAGDAIAEGIEIVPFIKAHVRDFLPRKQVELFPPPTSPHSSTPSVSDPEPPPLEMQPDSAWRIDDWIDAGLSLINSKPVANLSNVSLVLDKIMPDQIWFDEHRQRTMTWTSDRKSYREWTDEDDTMLTIEVQRRCRVVNAKRSDVTAAAQAHARKHLKNELIEFLDGLEWDGIQRMEHFFPDICNTKEGPYFRAVGRNFFISLVARAYAPGCKVDTMVVLEGPQGSRKSTLLEIIGGRWYAIMRDAPDTKDFAITLAGKWVIEIAEMDAFSRSDVLTVKRTLSTADDRYRPVFGTHAKDHPRRCVFAGSTNKTDWLTDETGARRFYPVACININIDAAREQRSQLLAEAVHAYRQGSTWWEVPEEDAKAERDARYAEDPWNDPVMTLVQSRVTATIPWVLEALGVEVHFHDKKAQMRIAGILTHAGWKKDTWWDDLAGRARRVWRRP